MKKKIIRMMTRCVLWLPAGRTRKEDEKHRSVKQERTETTDDGKDGDHVNEERMKRKKGDGRVRRNDECRMENGEDGEV